MSPSSSPNLTPMELEDTVSSHYHNVSKHVQNVVNTILQTDDELLSTDSTHVNGVVSHVPTPLVLPQNQNQVPDEIPVASNPFYRPVMTQDAVNIGNNGGGQGGVFQEVPYDNPNRTDQQHIGSLYFENQDMITLAVWPPPSQPFTCSCCELLREICHTNGTVFRKLAIHGTIGVFYHAILEQKNIKGDDPSGNQPHYKMFDFSRKSMEEVKQFLLEYCTGQFLEGYEMLPDPLRDHFEVYRIGFEWNEDLADGFGVDCPFSPVVVQKSTETVSSMSAQRERAEKLTLQELSNYFHLPIEAAAKEVNLCPTVVQRVCRQHKLFRWPYRKITSTKRRIAILKKGLESGDAVVRARAEAEIRRLEQDVTQHCAGFLPTAFHSD